MNNVFRESSIIPVTYEIRKYLKDTKITEDDKKRFSKIIDGSRYCIKKDRNHFIIFDYNDEKFYLDNIDKTNKKIKLYKDIASKINKSYVWVYQQIVLDGFGNYVDVNSDIYKSSLLAYEDIGGLDSQDEYVSYFEKEFILNGHIYDEDVYSKKKIK